MKLLYLPLLTFFLLLISPADNVDTVAQLIGRGSVPELVKLFAAEVEIGLPDAEEDTHPKAAAAVMLEKFFAQNRPTGSKILHKINNGGNIQYGVIILNTAKGHYRVSFNLKTENNTTQLTKILIEPEKVK